MQDSTFSLSSHSFANLPGELILEVFQYLSVKELCTCAQGKQILHLMYQFVYRGGFIQNRTLFGENSTK